MKITTEDFIKKAKELHPDKNYDYSKVVYRKACEKVEIICPIHGSFFQTPNSHNSSRHPQNCYKCSPQKKSNTEEFIEKAKKIHGNKYSYDECVYVTSKDKMKIYCKEHGEYFYQNANNHLQGQGCPCGKKEKLSKVNKKHSKKSFIELAKKKHGNKFDYKLVEFKDIKSVVKIICNKHDFVFEQVADNHLRSIHCCPVCLEEKSKVTKKKNINKFIEEAKEIHGDLYDYSLVKYVNGNTRVKIICEKHGVFEQLPRSHIFSKCGCPYCKSSNGEKIVEKVLIKNKIEFERQKYFKNCKLKRMLPFDFYLEKYNILIEYHGEQHYKRVEHFFKKNDTFELRKKRDKIKKQFAKESGMKFIVIPFTIKNEDDIEKIILDKII